MFLELSVAVVMAAETPACPPVPDGQPALVSRGANWLRAPTSDELWWAFPPKAKAAEVEGRATITCEVSEQGALEACEILSEEPPGHGFGEAALSATSKMQFTPAVRCGVVTRGTVTIPINFSFAPTVEAPTLSAAPLDPKDPKLALAARLVAALQDSNMTEAGLTNGVDATIALFEQERTVTAEEREAINDAARQAWTNGNKKILNVLARSFATRMSVAEMTSALAFYESSVGRKMVTVQQDLLLDIGRAYQAVEPEIIEEFEELYCRRMPTLCKAPPGLTT